MVRHFISFDFEIMLTRNAEDFDVAKTDFLNSAKVLDEMEK